MDSECFIISGDYYAPVESKSEFGKVEQIKFYLGNYSHQKSVNQGQCC